MRTAQESTVPPTGRYVPADAGPAPRYTVLPLTIAMLDEEVQEFLDGTIARLLEPDYVGKETPKESAMSASAGSEKDLSREASTEPPSQAPMEVGDDSPEAGNSQAPTPLSSSQSQASPTQDGVRSFLDDTIARLHNLDGDGGGKAVEAMEEGRDVGAQEADSIETAPTPPSSPDKRQSSPAKATPPPSRASVLAAERRAELAALIAKYEARCLEERRAEYRCGPDGYRTLDDVSDWVDVAADTEPCLESESPFSIRPDLNAKIGIFGGDMTALEVDAVVNAANEACLGGGGVDGAIHRAAGFDLMKACRLLGGCESGAAKPTFGFKLPAPLIIHAVGPRGHKPDLLRDTYRAALTVAKEAGVKSVAFCCISTGIFGFPHRAAAAVVCPTLRRFLEDEPEFAKHVRPRLALED